MKLSHIDHIVLTVQDIEASVQFYTSVLGMVSEVYADSRIALKFGQQKINLHQYQNEFEPKAKRPTPGAADLCLITETDIDSAIRTITQQGVTIIEGPVKRTGATGDILSIYFRDPDGNLIEISNQQ